MAQALRIQYLGAYYHITCRGNERTPIFADGQDEEVFFLEAFPFLSRLQCFHPCLCVHDKPFPSAGNDARWKPV
jgi:hypothetical protein